MSERLIVGIVSFCFAMSGLFLANMFLTMMIGEINRKRQEGNLVSYFFTSFKVVQIFSEYRSSYPKGNLHIYALLSLAVAMLGLISVAVCLHIIG